MSTYSEDKNTINALANKAELTEDDKKTVEELYLKVMKEPIKDCNCSNKWSDAVVKLALWYRQHSDYIVCNYTIAPGVVFLLDGVAYSRMNLTDEAAERLLEENPNAEKYITKNKTAAVKVAAKKATTATTKKK